MGDVMDRLDRDAEGWRPDPGDKIQGVIIGIDVRDSEYQDDTYPVLEIEDENTGDLIAVHGFHSVLKREIAQQKPEVGDRIGIKYFGKVQGKRTDSKGRPVEFEKYKVVVDRSVAKEVEKPDWDSMGAAADDEVRLMSGDDPQGATSNSDEEEPF